MTRETLAAEDAEDLAILSARLQDAVARVKDLVWLPKTRRFAAVLNRFKWEAATLKRGKGVELRVRCGLHFDGVRSVKSSNLRRNDPDAVLSLLAIKFTAKDADDPGGFVDLLFAGGGTVRLDVEYLDAETSDLSGEWAARGRPAHSLDES
jgi:hypothetical protein